MVKLPKFTNTARNYYFPYPPTWRLDSSDQDNVTVSNTGATFEVKTFLNTRDSYTNANAIWQLIFDDLTSNFPNI